MKGIILQILYASRRDALFLGTTFFVLCCTALSCFIGSNASTETEMARIMYTAGMSRIAIIIGFIIFVVFYIKRMFDNHEIEVILSHPISRFRIILALFVGFAIILTELIVPVFVILAILKVSITSLLVWSFSLLLEGLIVLSFALCCSLIINSQVHSLVSCIIMYILGRSIGSFISYIKISFQFSFYDMLESFLKVISVFIPRLDIFGKTSWLVYNNYNMQSIAVFFLQSLVFCGIFLCISIIDFRKKEF